MDSSSFSCKKFSICESVSNTFSIDSTAATAICIIPSHAVTICMHSQQKQKMLLNRVSCVRQFFIYSFTSLKLHSKFHSKSTEFRSIVVTFGAIWGPRHLSALNAYLFSLTFHFFQIKTENYKLSQQNRFLSFPTHWSTGSAVPAPCIRTKLKLSNEGKKLMLFDSKTMRVVGKHNIGCMAQLFCCCTFSAVIAFGIGWWWWL